MVYTNISTKIDSKLNYSTYSKLIITSHCIKYGLIHNLNDIPIVSNGGIYV